MGDGPNPFRMPTDEEVFALRDEEAQRKQAQREKVAGQHIWEKGKPQVAGGVRDFTSDRNDQAQAQAIQQTKVNLVAAATRDRRKEKENMADFIAKKREMFLVQMSLDTKRAEIRKLEERAQQREEALKKSEQMLQEDEMRFEEFLKDNAQNAEAAMKKAEAETKSKQEKVQEIKKLNAQIAQIKAEMSKYEEQLDDCRKYQEFLDKLTPEEWVLEQKARQAEWRRMCRGAGVGSAAALGRRASGPGCSARCSGAPRPPRPRCPRPRPRPLTRAPVHHPQALQQKRRAEKKAAKVAARQAEADAKAEADAAAAAAAAAAANAGKKKGRRSRRTEEGEEEGGGGKAAEVAVQRVVIRDEDVSTDEETEEERELPVYFKEPQQLLDIFTALEESNLFLIQNSQETEEALEELKVKFSETKTRMDAETVGLKAQIDTLRSSIRLEKDKGKALTERSGRNTGAHEQESTLSRLNSTVVEVYRAIFSEVDNSLSTLMMLTNIEAKLEELLTIIETMPREEVQPMPALLPPRSSLLPAPCSLLPSTPPFHTSLHSTRLPASPGGGGRAREGEGAPQGRARAQDCAEHRRAGGARPAIDPPLTGARRQADGQAGHVPLAAHRAQEEGRGRRRQDKPGGRCVPRSAPTYSNRH